MEDYQYFELITKHLSGNISEPEKAILHDWVHNSPDNTNLFNELKKIWELSGKYESDFQPDVNSAIERFKTRVSSSQTKRGLNFKLLFKVAAVLFFIASSAFVVNLIVNRNQNSTITKFASSHYSNGGFVLPDSSKVWLNKNSEISYESNFKERIVSLNGEAYFEVKKVNGKTFAILSGGTRTEVLGTSFIVKNIEETKDVEVVVLTGKVALSDLEGSENKKAVLQTGETGTFSVSKNTISITKNENLNVLAWKTNILTFRNSTVENVMNTLSGYFNKEIVFSKEDLQDCTLTSTFDHQSLDDVLEELQILWNIEFQHKGDAIVITKGVS